MNVQVPEQCSSWSETAFKHAPSAAFTTGDHVAAASDQLLRMAHHSSSFQV
jgi:hypothetical protein